MIHDSGLGGTGAHGRFRSRRVQCAAALHHARIGAVSKRTAPFGRDLPAKSSSPPNPRRHCEAHLGRGNPGEQHQTFALSSSLRALAKQSIATPRDSFRARKTCRARCADRNKLRKPATGFVAGAKELDRTRWGDGKAIKG